MLRLISLAALLTCLKLAGAQDLDLTEILGDVDGRQAACAKYRLPKPYNNATYDTEFLGPSRNVIVGSVNFTYQRFGPLDSDSDSDGENNTLVLIVGSAATSKVWPANLLRPLADNREVVIFNLPGIGSDLDFPSDQQTVDGIAQSLLGFFSALNLDQPDLLGWSLGGFYSLYLGVAYGDSVGSLILVSTTAGGDGYTPGLYKNPAPEPADRDVEPATLFPDTDDGNDGLCRFIAFKDIMPGHNASSQEIRNQSIVTGSALKDTFVSENLSNITNPVLIVHAQEDLLLDFSNAEYLYHNINQSYITYREYAGHAFILQDPDLLVPVFADFLDYYDDFDGGDDLEDSDTDDS